MSNPLFEDHLLFFFIDIGEFTSGFFLLSGWFRIVSIPLDLLDVTPQRKNSAYGRAYKAPAGHLRTVVGTL